MKLLIIILLIYFGPLIGNHLILRKEFKKSIKNGDTNLYDQDYITLSEFYDWYKNKVELSIFFYFYCPITNFLFFLAMLIGLLVEFILNIKFFKIK